MILRSGAILEPSGEATTHPAGMAKVLSDHWSKVLHAKGINTGLLTEWLQDDGIERLGMDPSPAAPDTLRLKRKHIIAGRMLKLDLTNEPSVVGIEEPSPPNHCRAPLEPVKSQVNPPRETHQDRFRS